MPRTWDDFDAYAAEVRVDLGNGRIRSGSGYVIGPCRILTALHVLIGQKAIESGAKVFIPGGIEVRVHGDFIVPSDTVPDRGFTRVRAETGGDYRWQPANLVWPIFFISGRIRDLPHEMIKRLRDEVAEALLGDRKPKTRSLQWRSKEHAANGVLGLQRDIVYHLTESRKIINLATLAEKAKGQDWTLEIDVCHSDARDIDALARFVKLFSGFGASPSPPALYIILFAGETITLAKEDARIQRFLEDLAQRSADLAHRVILVRDVFLEDCTYTHIRPWVECWGQVCEETAVPYSDHLELTFGNARPFPLRRVKEALSIVPAR